MRNWRMCRPNLLGDWRQTPRLVLPIHWFDKRCVFRVLGIEEFFEILGPPSSDTRVPPQSCAFDPVCLPGSISCFIEETGVWIQPRNSRSSRCTWPRSSLTTDFITCVTESSGWTWLLCPRILANTLPCQVYNVDLGKCFFILIFSLKVVTVQSNTNNTGIPLPQPRWTVPPQWC